MGSRKLNIRLQMESGGLMAAQYWTADGVQWAYGSSILDCRWNPVGSWQLNIGLRMGLNGLMAVQYWTADGAQWAHHSSILDSGWSPMG
jgi:hypothetical protein